MSLQNNPILMNLQFVDIILPVVKNQKGEDVVPLKPIADIFGLEWERQRKRVNDEYLTMRLSTSTVRMYWEGKERDRTCIRLDRVAAYLYSLNPEKIKSNGNISGACYLIEKHEEWDNVLAKYEANFGIHKSYSDKITHNKHLRELSASREARQLLIQKAKVHNPADKKTFALLIQQNLNQLGIEYDPEELKETA